MHHYPIDADEKKILQFINLLTEDSRKRYVDFTSKYLFKLKNSQAFREQCERQRKHGFNSFGIWIDKNNFEPVLKKAL